MKYAYIYRTSAGDFHLPFAHLAFMVRMEGVRILPEEGRAASNMHQFIMSLGIMTERLRGYLGAYRDESWEAVPFNELFLDTQGLFLFVQQFLEDVALLMRMAYPDGVRQQMPRNFRDLMQRITEQASPDDSLRIFLEGEHTFFAALKDARDDLLHRTSFDRSRERHFPDLFDVMRAGGGKAEFLAAPDLRSYIGTLIDRVFALACLADDFAFARLRDRFGKEINRPPAVIVSHGKIDFANTNDREPPFPPGTISMEVPSALFENLEYFLNPT